MKTLILSGLIFYSNLTIAKMVYVPNAKVPTEFALLLTSVQKDGMTEDLAKLPALIKSLDYSLSILSRDEAHFLLKSDIYKAILKENQTSVADIAGVGPRLLKRLDKARSLRHGLSPFVRWLASAIYTDLNGIVNDPYFRTYLYQKKTKKVLDDKRSRLLDKKISLIAPWAKKLVNVRAEELNKDLVSFMMKILDRTTFAAELQVKWTKFPEELPKKGKSEALSIFKYQEMDNLKKSPGLEELVDQVIKDEKLAPNLSSKDEWRPKGEHAKNALPPNYPTPDPNYKAPEELPRPVNDWIFDF